MKRPVSCQSVQLSYNSTFPLSSRRQVWCTILHTKIKLERIAYNIVVICRLLIRTCLELATDIKQSCASRRDRQILGRITASLWRKDKGARQNLKTDKAILTAMRTSWFLNKRLVRSPSASLSSSSTGQQKQLFLFFFSENKFVTRNRYLLLMVLTFPWLLQSQWKDRPASIIMNAIPTPTTTVIATEPLESSSRPRREEKPRESRNRPLKTQR